jgi:hypothetical protein
MQIWQIETASYLGLAHPNPKSGIVSSKQSIGYTNHDK